MLKGTRVQLLVFLLCILLLIPNPAECWWRRRRRRCPHPPDNPPYFTRCPSEKKVNTDEADGKKSVSYNMPEAADDRRLNAVRRIEGLSSGSKFPSGRNRILYEAVDSANQRAHCEFYVTVTVLRCPGIQAEYLRWHSCSKDNIAGSFCTFHCPTGYDVVGSSTSLCKHDLSWSTPSPTCQVKTCTSLPDISNGGYSCSNSNKYNSVCTYYCNDGFGFQPGDSQERTCQDSWSGTAPSCIDTLPPVFDSCPRTLSREADDAATSALVSWAMPTAMDNVPSGLTVFQIQGLPPGSRFSEGSQTIQYQARDAQGNTALCTFSVTVIVITCTALSAGDGLVINCPSGQIKGAMCTFQCDAGYQLLGGSSAICQSDQSWNPPQPTCEILRCPRLDPPAQGNFRDSQPCGVTFGSWCYFVCDTGYRIIGSPARHCVSRQDQASAFWDGTATECQIITCEVPQLGTGLLPTQPDVCSTGRDVAYNAFCSFECAEGYSLQGESSMTCGGDGQWQQTLPWCTEITCASSNLPAPVNGVKTGCSREHESYGTICTLSCNRGYTPTAPMQRTCQSDENDSGVWSGQTISCSIVTCPRFPSPTNGFKSRCVRNGQNVTTGGLQRFDTTCTSACNEGYTIFGTATRNCLVSGTWDGTSVECRDEKAPALQCPVNQVIFTREGHSTVTVSWHWEPVKGTDAGREITAMLLSINSVPVTGPKPSTLEEGTYSLVYSATDNAGNSGSCSMQLEARVTRCTGLTVPQHGDIDLATGHGSCLGGAVYGSVCEISCNTGYTLSTEGATLRRRCNRLTNTSSQGYWTLEQPTCRPNWCPFPSITHGYISSCLGNGTTFGNSCPFHCDPGHRTASGESNRNRQCQADGSWSGPDFQCTVAVTCPGSFLLPHGWLDPPACRQNATLPYNTTCRFSCDDGFLQQGPTVKTCTDSGEWDNLQSTVCLDEQPPSFDVSCPQSVEVNSDFGVTSKVVTFEVPTATDNSGMVNVNRVSGHMAPGSRFPEGRTTVTYTATDPSALSSQCDVIVTVVVHRCERLQVPISGSINCDRSSPVVGTNCTLRCNIGYTLNGSQDRTCQLSSDDTPYWDGETTVCTIVKCPAQTAPPHSIKSGCNLPSEPYGTECSFYCENGYEAQTSDDGRSRCLADGTWSGTDLVCNETRCPVLSPGAGIALTPYVCYGQPVFGHNCLLSCTQDGFVIDPPGSDYVTCRSNGKWSYNISAIQCVDRQNPRFTSCPSVIVAYVDKGSTSAQVNYSLFTVDNDGTTPTVACDPGSDWFNIGDHRVSCVATDRANNSATCSFLVEVNERMCPVLSPPFFGEFVGECDNVYGSVCNLSCNTGYRLVGSSVATCEFDGNLTYWHQEDVPSCELISCDALSPGDTVQTIPPVCTTGSPLAGTRCSFFCLNDFSLVGGVSSKLCTAESMWEGGVGDLPVCKDETPPVITFCPGPIYVTVENVSGTPVTFDTPTARDNDPSDNLTLTTSPVDVGSPYNFTKSTLVVYTFTDAANHSVTCTFLVQIVDGRGPVVVFCPTSGYNVTTETSLTEVTWEEPVFEDPSGDELEISNNRGSGNMATFPWGTHVVMYTATDTSNGKTAVCEFLIDVRPEECPRLDAPDNGALACDKWAYGRFCNIFCNDNFDIPRLSSSQRPPNQYVCGLSGVWTPHNFVPDCSETKNPRRANLPSELMYFTGDCSSPETRDSIAAAFITLLQNSNFANVCDPSDDCTVGNVHVMCGRRDQRRRKRSLNVDVSGKIYQSRLQRYPVKAEQETIKWNKMRLRFDEMAKGSPRRHIRETGPWEAVISFEFSVNIHHAENRTSFSSVVNAESTMIEAAESFISSLEDGTTPALEVPGLSVVLVERSGTYSYATVSCEPGYLANNDDYRCSACSTGFFYDNSTGECHFCPRGYYQEAQAQFTCDQCPPGTTTVVEGAKNETWCEEACLAGSFSSNGVVPCLECMQGEYQPLPGQTSCVACPNGTTTQDYGAQSFNQCQEICNPGNVSDTGLAPCRPCERSTYQPLTQQLQCMPCPNGTTTLTTGATSIEECKEINECESSPCEHQATCVDLMGGYRCDCPPGYHGIHCEIDNCMGHVCANGATCVSGSTNYLCQCRDGYEGDYCKINFNECASSPCEHEGVCSDQINGYHCQCTSNYHGAQCELEINGCSPSPCQNGAVCSIVDAGYRCDCAPGYSGTNCTLDINECSSSPCLNGATCQDKSNGYDCICRSGYEGTHCETDMDWCADTPCHNSSTCVDLGSTFRCVCPLDRVGDLCETLKTPCHDTPCINGATCVVNAYDPDLYTCQCVAGYTGLNCEKDYNECASGPCSNGGTCIDELNAFMCECPPGYEGHNCASDINECSSNPCGVGNTCEDEVNGYICSCQPGFTGTHCENRIDYCSPSACQHGATCNNTLTGYQCICAAGFAGMECELDIDECALGPCQHGGNCTDLVNGYVCQCREGFYGSVCQINIIDCFQDACQNSGTCIDGINDYTCICPDGFTGTRCEEPVDYCQSHPCQHSSVCQNDPPGYRCTCTPGFVGPNCEEDFNECSLFPCVHASSCVDGVNNYTCICEEGYDGMNCEREIDECASSPCLYGGTCLNLVARFVCSCVDWRTGGRCEEQMDWCQNKPCLNQATCQNMIQDFRCLCAEGYTGELCDEDIKECDSSPCQHGSECEDQLNAYVCRCSPGYSGVNCEEEINECQVLNVECQHGGTCVDKLAGFECLCSEGYRGQYCEDKINQCHSDPCQNGGTCMDGIAAFSCECPTGFAGPRCEVQMNLCLGIPCSNGAICSPMPGGFSCTCPAGYSGELCDLNVDECSSEPCLHQASCIDQVYGYQCICLPGFMGDHCETVLPTDFDIHFWNQSAGSHLIQTSSLTSRDLEALSASLWVRSQRCHGDFILLKLSTPAGTAIKLSHPSELKFNILGLETDIGGSPNLCDSHWHNVLLTWHSLNGSQEWRLYVDRSVVSHGTSRNSTLIMPHGLVLSLGPSAGWNVPTGSSELALSGVNIWSRAWGEAEVPDIASSCRPVSPADVFAWSNIMITPSPAVTQTLRVPSQCDDFDECSSNPCEAGTCEDLLGTFVCHCPEGLEGDRCQTSTDYCQPYSCLNSATCYSENLAHTCVCPIGYNGTHCELETVNGNWGPWQPFSECTKTCGGGERHRSRSCDNPQPVNGGRPCPGEAYQMQECNIVKCPACRALRRPYRGELDCNETADGEKFCRISCRKGYAFGRDIVEVYHCGPSSKYSWSHQTENNTYARFPPCVKIQPYSGRVKHVLISLLSTDCDSPSAKEDIKKAVTQSAVIKQQSCIVRETCRAEVTVGSCSQGRAGSGRIARQAASRVDVSISFFSNETSTAENGTADSDELSQAAQSLVDLIKSGEFTVTISGEVVRPDLESLEEDEWGLCPEGTVTSQGGPCIYCGQGTFHTMSADVEGEYECRPCPVNTYQDQAGQTACIMCPYGLVTNGHGASDVSECHEQCGAGEYHVVSDITEDMSCEPCPLNWYNPGDGVDYCLPCPDGLVTNKTGATHKTDCYLLCGQGTFQTTSANAERDYECRPCPVNTYQNQVGQTACVMCPDHRVTNGHGAIYISECFEPTTPIVDTSSVSVMTSTIQPTVPPDPPAVPLVVVISVTALLAILVVAIIAIVCMVKVKSFTKVRPDSSSSDDERPCTSFTMQPRVNPEDFQVGSNIPGAKGVYEVGSDTIPSGSPPPYEPK
ncbi:sushi, von Willebrand factor type A, EGF and pentraxin domain-containing protein 1-like [Acanthaster planci]|uniref:Sushi, von Willebrand factor type A, EGF and pentraxin domain-containing protein 1-like n=1 Tax=Acanthaster planci TaxID=133434 RepID=A0A8B7ZL01_ACAPL|nr:sushi, von Willebrand factor type A, EGF and pentraxin domain-containing protein 1-like [Acanthaster planci]